MQELLEKSLFEIPNEIKRLLWGLVGLGITMFVFGLVTGNEEGLIRTWQVFLINVLFWGGIAQGGVIFAVIWQLTDAKWGRPFKRFAEACGAFLPVSFVLFLLVFVGSHILYEWTREPFMHNGHAVKAGWLNIYFFISRNIVAMLLMYGITFVFMKLSLKPDFGLARTKDKNWGGTFADRLLKGYGSHEEEVVRLELLSRRVAPALAIIYGICGSLMAFDFVMSLDQEWFSTLFGAFFLVGNLQAALAVILIVGVTVRQKLQLEEYLCINRIHDMAKLIMALTMVWTYFAFSQFLVIWYGNLAEETPYLIIRSVEEPWRTLFVLLFFWLFISVFFGLMPRTLCRNPNFVRAAAVYVAVGQWLSIYLMVVPSLQEPGNYHFYFGLHEIMITLGFLGGFLLCYLTFLGKVPILPISDKHLCKGWHGH
ncbi:molybdopterin oxidoreductase [Deltaproteobacteria bacterium TL4]